MDNTDKIQEVLERLVRIETKLDNYNEFKDKTDDAYNISKQNAIDISDIKDNNKWLWRTTVAAIIVAVVGFLFTAIKF